MKRLLLDAVFLAGCASPPATVALPAPAHVAVRPAPAIVARGPVVPDAFFDEPPEGPYPSLAEYCRFVLARHGNDAPRFCDADPAFARQARIPGARFVSHDAGGDFVLCSPALELPRGWYVLEGFECGNTMNEDPYDFRLTELSRESDATVVVRASVTITGERHSIEARCGVGASRVPRCVALVTEVDGRSTGVRFDGNVVVLGPEVVDEGGGELRSPGGLLPETPPGRYRIVFP